jgi:hypothetical protein
VARNASGITKPHETGITDYPANVMGPISENRVPLKADKAFEDGIPPPIPGAYRFAPDPIAKKKKGKRKSGGKISLFSSLFPSKQIFPLASRA